MHNRTNYGQPPHILGSFLIDTTDGEEQYDADLSSSQDGRCAETDRIEYVRGCPESHCSCDHSSIEEYLQATSQYKILSYMAPHQNDKPQCDTIPGPYGQVDSSGWSVCIDPTLLTAHRPFYDQIPSFSNHNDKLSEYGSRLDQLTGISACVRRQQEHQSSAWNDTNALSYPSNQDGDFLPGYDEVVENQIHHTSIVSQDVGGNASMGEPQDVFMNGVLDRSHNHQATLKTYTDKLVGQMRVSMDAACVQQDHTAFGSADPSLHLSRVESSQATAISSSSLQAIQAQLMLGGGVESQLVDRNVSSEFRYFVKEDTPVVLGPTVSDSQSMLASNDMLRPSSNSHPSDAASLAGTDTSSGTLSCRFEGCKVVFTGRYGRGNLGRHRRQKHGNHMMQYRCEDEHCTKIFQRKDARLKHYRRAHPDLNAGPAWLQKGSSSASSDWTHAGHLHTNNNHGSPHDNQISFDDLDVSSQRDV